MISFTIEDVPQETIRNARVIRNHYLIACSRTKAEKFCREKDEPFEIDIRVQYLKPEKTKFVKPLKPPDIHAITIAVLDALKGVAYSNESQIVKFSIKRVYVDDPDKRGLKVTLK